MMTLILYGAEKKLTDYHKPVMTGSIIRYFVRVEVRHDTDALHALEKAQPQPGETVLNSVDIP